MIDPFATRLTRFAGAMPGGGLALERLRIERIRYYAPRTDIVCEGDPPWAVRRRPLGWACRYKISAGRATADRDTAAAGGRVR